MRAFRRWAKAWLPFCLFVVATTPIWLFFARVWWSWTHALLTKPWAEILCFGFGCQP